MFYKFFISAILYYSLQRATKPKDDADASGSGSTSSDGSVSDGTITETAGSGIVAGSQEDLIVNVGDRVFLI